MRDYVKPLAVSFARAAARFSSLTKEIGDRLPMASA